MSYTSGAPRNGEPPRDDVNPILADLRATVRHRQTFPHLHLERYGLEDLTPIQVVRQAMVAGMYYAQEATPEHHLHAHRVLDKLEKNA